MKRLLLLLWLGLPFAICAQGSLPMWTHDAVRQRDYPAREWYTGFVRDRLKADEDVGAALRNLERAAQNQLAENIIVMIESDSRLRMGSEQHQSGGQSSEVITTNYRQVITTATSATTVKTEVRSYHDPETGTLYAFATVRRSDLAAFYKRQINTDLNKVEIAIGASEQLVASGKKMDAHRRIEEAKRNLNDISYLHSLLIAVDPTVCEDNDMQTPRFNELSLTVEQLLITLQRSTFVYIDCSYEFRGRPHDAFSSDPGILCDIIKRALEENGCTITDNEENADYKLTLITSTTQRSDGSGTSGILSYYANARGMLYNRLTNRQAANFSISDKVYSATGRTPEAIATRAFNNPELKNAILDKILPEIKN
ncbi:MAG: hypothetical protein FWE63_03985 [Bacteroidales bacterium]|nr:hypothetical protein [Bacteroidales bacterium]